MRGGRAMGDDVGVTATVPPTYGLPPAGWYPDPIEPRRAQRWWDGVSWSEWQARDGEVSARPVVPTPAPGSDWTGIADERAPWPKAALAWALAAIVGCFLLGSLGAWLTDRALDNFPLELLANVALLDGGLLAVCIVVQRRWGTDGGFRRDFGLTYERGDWWRGILGSIGARSIGAAASSLFVLPILFNRDPSSYDDAAVARSSISWAGILAFAVVALVVAPFVEEVFFRGLLQRSLESALPRWIAIGVQGVIFGFLHVQPAIGIFNVAIVVPISVAGMVFGFTYHRFKRLGPNIAAHFWFNAVAIGVLVAVGPG
jgi:membrane protease YdiL (CAAX protease family)